MERVAAKMLGSLGGRPDIMFVSRAKLANCIIVGLSMVELDLLNLLYFVVFYAHLKYILKKYRVKK